MKYSFQPLFLVLPLLIGLAMSEYLFSHDSPGAHQAAYSSTGNTPHPPGLPSIWKGRNVTELVESLGEPDDILDTTFRGFVIYGDTTSIMYVYVDEGSGVYHAYVVEHDTGEILAYQRR